MLSVVLIEGVASFATGSLALAGDAAHAVFDAISTLILFVATNLSLKPADEDHTYGHGKIETLGALTAGFSLLVLAGALGALALSRFGGATYHVEASFFGYSAALYTLVVEVLRVAILTAGLKTDSLAVKAGLYHAVSDFASTGLVFVGLGLTSVGYPTGDTFASILIISLLIILSARLIYTSTLELSDAVSGKLVKSIMDEIKRTDEVLKVKELRARRAGPMTHVDAVIAVSPYARVTEADTIASRVETSLKKLLGPSSIMIHIEPLEWKIPLELQIREATSRVQGVRGVHNLTVTTIDEELFVTLHVQVDPRLALDHAHEISESIEKAIRATIPKIRQVTIHLEPSIAESSSGRKIDDHATSETVRRIVEGYPDGVNVSSIALYSTAEGMRVNIRCRFNAKYTIAEVHDVMTKIENEIRLQYPNAIVTIQPEPTSTE